MGKKGKKILGIVILIIAIGMIAYGIINFLFSPKMKMISILFNNFQSSLKNYNNQIDASGEFFKINTDTLLETTDLKIELNGDIYSDYNNSKLYTNLTSKINNQKYISPEVYFDTNELYFKIKEISDKLYFIKGNSSSIIQSSVITSLSDDDKKAFFDLIKDKFNRNLDDSRFTKTNETIKLSGKSYKTSKYTVGIRYADMTNILLDVIDDIQNQDELKGIRLFIESKTDLNSIKEALLNQTDENTVWLTYTIYVDGNEKIIKNVLDIDGTVLTLSKYKNNNNYDNIELDCTSEGNTFLTATVVGGKTSIVDINLLSMINIKGTIEKQNDILNKADFKIISSFIEESEIASFSYTKTEIVKWKEYKVSFKFNTNSEEDKVNLNMNNNVTYDVQMPVFDKTNAIDYAKLGEENEFTKFFESNPLNKVVIVN